MTKMGKAEIQILSDAVSAIRVDLERDLQRFCEGAIESHRRRMWVRETWCCKEMATFAAHVWQLPNPPTRDETAFGSTALSLRGAHVNYCPFCGVRV